MKKRASPLSASSPSSVVFSRGRLWLGLQLIIWLSVLACSLALIRIAARSPSLDAAVGEETPLSGGTPKIAFLFLSRSHLPLDFVWHAFFQNAEEEKYSIYVHSEPGFVFDRTTTRSPFFFGRQIPDSIKVIWGESTMIEAERLLLAAALKDPANQRFAFISDSCVPLYNFSYIYNYVISSPKSFVDSFLDKKEGRYSPKMFPTIPRDRWRKGSQRLSGGALGGKQKNMSQLDDELERRTLTYTSWNQSIDAKDKRSWHPKTFEFADASPQHITEIKGINHVYYETEYRTEWCQCNATFVPCFLFARKFSRGAAMRILNDGLVGPFDAGSLFFPDS
ncbi:hypothetical protein ZIOFF_048551 [Zingiber officinale]|uniref:Core-2/I-branching beta-1,6-N-acetylglucosaminyltransferase family protein n=1 Tax=Zingiber officinale TaxID=94328 RepID=A0A8J5FSL1_ZINOF|nr:hypothetical protein ZIOFF_048551 [Zingiber officinale]